MKLKKPSMKNRLIAVVSAGALAASMVAMPMTALAYDPYTPPAPISPSAEGPQAAGTTDVTVQLVNPGEQYQDNENLRFKVPTKINFVAATDGTLAGPSASSAYIQNDSEFGIHVSSFDVDAYNGWTIIANGATATAENSADFQFGPEGHELDAASYLSKAAVDNQSGAWDMYYAGGNNSNKVELSTSGNIYKVTQNINSQVKIAEIRTFVTPGLSSSVNNAGQNSLNPGQTGQGA